MLARNAARKARRVAGADPAADHRLGGMREAVEAVGGQKVQVEEHRVGGEDDLALAGARAR